MLRMKFSRRKLAFVCSWWTERLLPLLLLGCNCDIYFLVLGNIKIIIIFLLHINWTLRLFFLWKFDKCI